MYIWELYGYIMLPSDYCLGNLLDNTTDSVSWTYLNFCSESVKRVHIHIIYMILSQVTNVMWRENYSHRKMWRVFKTYTRLCDKGCPRIRAADTLFEHQINHPINTWTIFRCGETMPIVTGCPSMCERQGSMTQSLPVRSYVQSIWTITTTNIDNGIAIYFVVSHA